MEDEKKLHIFQMDLFYSTQISQTNAILEKYNNTFEKEMQSKEVKIHSPKNIERVERSSERPWKEWVNEIRIFSAELNELLSRITNFHTDKVILTGNSPHSLYTYFGYLLQRAVLIATDDECDEQWQLFHVYSPSHSTVENFDKGGKILALEKISYAPEGEKARSMRYSPSIAKKRLAVLFVTLNSDYSLSCDDLIDISNQVRGHHGFDGNFDEFYRLSPLDHSLSPISLPPMRNNNLEEITIFGDIREDIRKAYDTIYADCDYDGLVIISSGPKHLAYLIGMLFDSNIYGDFILCERVNSRFNLVL